uniref:Uncharacterized protein n=8 Tax=unclassified Caudoviricetes TaxID=2788787 RepID=A0AB39U207_9CAUD
MQDRCARPGCVRTVKNIDRHRACSAVCQHILLQIENAERVCNALGDEGLTGQYRDVITAWSEAWTRAQELDYRLYQEAKSVGMRASDWESLKRGKASHPPS